MQLNDYMKKMLAGRSLRGNVDRNMNIAGLMNQFQVVPYVGTWIEICLERLECMECMTVVPYVGTWIEIDRS